MSRALTEVLARRFAEDLALVEEMLALVEEDREEWRPDWPPSAEGQLPFTVRELAGHLVMAWGGVLGCLKKLHPEALGHWVEWEGGEGLTVAAARRRLEEGGQMAAEGWALVRDEELGRMVGTYFRPEGEAWLEIVLKNGKHWNHHGHQLFVYLKLMGVRVGSRELYRFAGEKVEK